MYRSSLAGVRPALIAFAVATSVPAAAQQAAEVPPATAPQPVQVPAASEPAAPVQPEAQPAAAASAQPVGTAAAPAESGCELHVFPSERFQAITTGWLSGFGLIGGLIDSAANSGRNRTNASQLGSALDSAGQARTLAAMDLTGLLNLPGYRIVSHEEPIAPSDARRRSRHAQSGSQCYAELIVTRVFYQRAAIYGRSLRVSFLFRDFGAATQPSWTYAGRGGNGLSVFPPSDEAQVEAANTELLNVFRLDFEEYARNLQNACGQRRGRRS